MDPNILNQVGRSTFIIPTYSNYAESYRFSPINYTPNLAFGANVLTSTFLPLAKDELEIDKKLQRADQPSVTVLEQDIKTDAKITKADFSSMPFFPKSSLE